MLHSLLISLVATTPASIFGRKKGKVAEADPVESQAIRDATSNHQELMEQAHALFQRVGHYKQESMKQAIILTQQGFPLLPAWAYKEDYGPEIGTFDNGWHEQYSRGLAGEVNDILAYRDKLQRHHDVLYRAQDYRQQVLEAAKVLTALEKAYEWSNHLEKDPKAEARQRLQQLRAGKNALKDIDQRNRELRDLEERLAQVQQDLSTLL